MEELNRALADLITQATTGVEAASGFLQAEIPEVVMQLLAWNFYINLIWFGVGVGAFGISLALTAFAIHTAFAIQETTKNTEQDDDIRFACATIAAVVLFTFSLFFLNVQWLKIWVAPKVWLIEYAARLL
tara:strand:- start:216 stop:605 length:390 start_codon:yes stop_codon:yes gene_type:complete